MKADLTKKAMRTRKQVKSAKARAEAKVIKAVRAACVERDQGCRLAGHFGVCQGQISWCHMEGKRRHQTRNMAPEERHGTAWTVMLCGRHAEMEERHQIRSEYLTDKGADGLMRFVYDPMSVAC